MRTQPFAYRHRRQHTSAIESDGSKTVSCVIAGVPYHFCCDDSESILATRRASPTDIQLMALHLAALDVRQYQMGLV